MSDIMRPVPFGRLMDWALEEYRKSGSIFGVSDPVKYSGGQALPIYGEKIEAPFGPAAGPNTQLAQNIIAAYAAGARFFALKTVLPASSAYAAFAAPVSIASGASAPSSNVV